MPTSIWEYIGASFGSLPREARKSAMMYSTWPAMSDSKVPYVPPPEPGLESRTRMRKPSALSSMYRSRVTAAASNLGREWSPSSAALLHGPRRPRTAPPCRRSARTPRVWRLRPWRRPPRWRCPRIPVPRRAAGRYQAVAAAAPVPSSACGWLWGVDRSPEHHDGYAAALSAGFTGVAAFSLRLVIPPRLRVAVAGRLADSRASSGQRTSYAQPSFSNAQITRALESIWPFSTPCLAQVGSAWCRLCQDSPKDAMASHETFRDRSRASKSSVPNVWQIELIDQVTWCSSVIRTRLAQKNAVIAPCQDIPHRPPITAGSSSDTPTSGPNSRSTILILRSASRSGENFSCEVRFGSNSQSMCAYTRPLASAQALSP